MAKTTFPFPGVDGTCAIGVLFVLKGGIVTIGTIKCLLGLLTLEVLALHFARETKNAILAAL